MAISKIFKVMRIALGGFFLSLATLSFLAPIIQSAIGYPGGENIYSGLSNICHQYPTRSLWITNRPFALCSRCFGGYLGISLALLFVNSTVNYSRRIALGIILALPGIVDGGIQLITTYESTNIIRFISGFLGGLGLFYIFFSFMSNSQNKKGVIE